MTHQIQQGHIKSDSENFFNVMKYLFQINAVLLNFIFRKKSRKKCIMVSTNNIELFSTLNICPVQENVY